MYKINLLGSTGSIGRKTLKILNKNFSNYKINFLLAKNNYKLLATQANKNNPNIIVNEEAVIISEELNASALDINKKANENVLEDNSKTVASSANNQDTIPIEKSEENNVSAEESIDLSPTESDQENDEPRRRRRRSSANS